MTQQEVLDIIYRARSLEEISKAEKVVNEWLRDYPDDYSVRGTAELLIRTKEALVSQ